MTVAARSSLRGGIPHARKLPGRGRRIASRVSAGLAVAAIAAVATSAVAIGLAHLLTLSFAARSDARFAVAIAAPPGSPALQAPRAVGMAEQWKIVASLSPPPTRTPAPSPPIALAMVSPNTPGVADAGPDVTGSINVYSLASTDSADRPSVRLEPQPMPMPASPSMPMPRPRPQLAALTPFQGLGIKPDDDASFRKTAIYDITAQTVYLPSGERLEAHSGLGRFMDDPRHVHRRMRGATPPNTYRLKLREALFHGVRAIRMTPEKDDEMFGRDGILAHTYMLGPSGQSNGCVSFKDYPKFLRAFLRGEVERMVVVARLDRRPAAVARREVPRTRNSGVF